MGFIAQLSQPTKELVLICTIGCQDLLWATLLVQFTSHLALIHTHGGYNLALPALSPELAIMYAYMWDCFTQPHLSLTPALMLIF